jgi:hypothetical protein
MAHRDLREIYRARNLQEAALLKNLLEEEGIRATVTNNVLEGGSGVDVLGWATQPRVMVAQADAEEARQIALEYEQHGEELLQKQAIDLDDKARDEGHWPRCPSCGRRRLTFCPHCGTAGTEFPEGDMDINRLLGLDPPPADAAPCCGPAGCTPSSHSDSRHSERCEESTSAVPQSSSFSPLPTILLCPTCDEPFAPQYLRRCEWCGHEFPDGVEMDFPPRESPAVSLRIIFTIAALVILVIFLIAYMAWLF